MNDNASTERALVKTDTESADQFELMVVFLLNEQEYGLMARSVREIIRNRPTTRVPNCSRIIEGVINLRGQIIPVFHMRRRLGLSDDFSSETVMIVEVDGDAAGLLVDRVVDVVKIDPALVDKTARGVESKLATGFIDGTVNIDDRLITVLQLEPLVEDD